MAERIQKPKTFSKEEEKSAPIEAKHLQNEELDSTTDALIDEIEDLLEEARGEQTVEEFVQGYVQRGGQ